MVARLAVDGWTAAASILPPPLRPPCTIAQGKNSCVGQRRQEDESRGLGKKTGPKQPHPPQKWLPTRERDHPSNHCLGMRTRMKILQLLQMCLFVPIEPQQGAVPVYAGRLERMEHDRHALRGGKRSIRYLPPLQSADLDHLCISAVPSGCYCSRTAPLLSRRRPTLTTRSNHNRKGSIKPKPGLEAPIPTG